MFMDEFSDNDILYSERSKLGDLLVIRAHLIEKYQDVFHYNCTFYINNISRETFVAQCLTYSDLIRTFKNFINNY